jgi:hypothetical protein
MAQTYEEAMALHDGKEYDIWLPSKYQWNHFRNWVMIGNVADNSRPYKFYGWCPLHDRVRDPNVPTAIYQFHKAVMRCLADEPCHEGKRGITLVDLMGRL